MSIRNGLTLLFTIIVSSMLVIFCLFIYAITSQHRKKDFQNRLKAEANTSAELLFGQETISPTLYKLLDKNQITVLPHEELIIYNDQNKIIYESGSDYLTIAPTTLAQVRQQKEIYWQEGDREIVGSLFVDESKRLLVFTSAVDIYGLGNQHNLAIVLGIGWGFMTVLMLVVGRYFSGRSLEPISRINQRIDEVNASQLSLRLPEGPHPDELTQLARRFNRMLDRLEEAFRMQRAFVSHASHELRTPLTTITGQLEVSLLADENPDELRATLHSVLEDVRGLNRLTNGLLGLTKVSMDESAVPMSIVNIDTLLEQVRTEVQRLNPTYAIQVSVVPLPFSTRGWQLTGNDALLRTALFNLMENGGKFSPDHTVFVELTATGKATRVTFQNHGPVISADQLPDIFVPFRRGDNAIGIPGSGIGLSLTERIIRLHQGTITVESTNAMGTIFTLTFPVI
ncbi:HAMP domain-containing sensor histidine kinase [Spirosoma validum]|uniref:histidine kinase n=1 Tax=Spirosoma validum TaxID=2771355 RepID=A0A927GEY2_9BACT|nr:HAMP domain-containing sensor histidine kinase [Spirosoma validum]MBD2755095.1 HAMP domain-containing histidine kinase [Spirosoma validum]